MRLRLSGVDRAAWNIHVAKVGQIMVYQMLLRWRVLGVLLLYRDSRILLSAEITALWAATLVHIVFLLTGLGLVSRSAMLADNIFNLDVPQWCSWLRPGWFGNRGCLWRDASFLCW